jgi:AcrR family transcriptional regulator
VAPAYVLAAALALLQDNGYERLTLEAVTARRRA